MEVKEKRKCWYCEKMCIIKKGNLFCKKCEKIKIKNVNRPEQENFYAKV